MKIMMIRHAKADAVRRTPCTAAEYAEDAAGYEAAGILPIGEPAQPRAGRPVYVSAARRAKETAGQLFALQEEDLIETPLLNEVPLAPFTGTDRRLPLAVWDAAARVQWALGIRRQPEIRRESRARADALIDMLEADGRDCFVVTHGFFLHVLIGRLRRRGYVVEGRDLVHVPCLGRVRATRRSDHCGGCRHNCLLEDPGCDIGRAKAEGRDRAKIKKR